MKIIDIKIKSDVPALMIDVFFRDDDGNIFNNNIMSMFRDTGDYVEVTDNIVQLIAIVDAYRVAIEKKEAIDMTVICKVINEAINRKQIRKS